MEKTIERTRCPACGSDLAEVILHRNPPEFDEETWVNCESCGVMTKVEKDEE